jgi:hypothetical protein
VAAGLARTQLGGRRCRLLPDRQRGAKGITVKTQIVRGTGVVALEFEEAVQPRQSEALTIVGGGEARCRFIGAFVKGLVRASIDIFAGVRSIAVAPAE